VKALWGGNDFRKSQFDLAIQGRMQPGSCFKPIVYATALKEHVVAPNSIIVDEPLSLPGSDPEKPWQPENFDRKYMGPITIRTALTYSRNVISVKLARLVGIKAVVEQARRMGISVPISSDLSIALGSSAVPPVQLVQAYSTFPNLGKTVQPQFVDAVLDRDDHLLEELEPRYHESLDPVTAFQMTLLLEGVIRDGTGRNARKLKWPAGGKTGTTDNYRDAWFMGFTPEVVTGVWVGRRDKKSLGRLETGGRVACPIWTSFMKITLENAEKKDFAVPEGVALVPVNRKTGEIVAADPEKDRSVVWEAFPVDELPTLEPSTGIFNVPLIIEKIGDFFR
jgi:penicillin-binding protein 1A